MDFIVVGIGFWGKEWAELLKAHPLATVVATVDVKERAALWSKETLGIPCFRSVNQAMESVPSDAVLVVTNPDQHKPVILKALRHAKHVLLEKPMVTSIELTHQTASHT